MGNSGSSLHNSRSMPETGVHNKESWKNRKLKLIDRRKNLRGNFSQKAKVRIQIEASSRDRCSRRKTAPNSCRRKKTPRRIRIEEMAICFSCRRKKNQKTRNGRKRRQDAADERERQAVLESLRIESQSELGKLELQSASINQISARASHNNSTVFSGAMSSGHYFRDVKLPMFDKEKDDLDAYLCRFERTHKTHGVRTIDWSTHLARLQKGSTCETTAKKKTENNRKKEFKQNSGQQNKTEKLGGKTAEAMKQEQSNVFRRQSIA